MNIKDAKEQIKNAVIAYTTRNKFGRYEIPESKQRPVFLVGPPGIGKTAIMEQISQELDIGLVTYSMTHHTRQSALGLPFITEKTFAGREYSVTEYTMSEIIASIYEVMEDTGKNEGILFLDEVNCISETLAPSMLQFLQYKVFGRHKVPEGWVIVTAGNPPEYNNSVREMDMATLDRLKKIVVEPDFNVWLKYALTKGVHPAITTFLKIKPRNFYKVETTVNGKAFVTARGWEDLSSMIRLYEQDDLRIDEDLMIQYLQDKKTAKDFATYFDLFKKYRSDYQVEKILEGKEDDKIRKRASEALFDERLALISLMLSLLTAEARDFTVFEKSLLSAVADLKELKKDLIDRGKEPIKCMEKFAKISSTRYDRSIDSASVSNDQKDIYKLTADEEAEELAILAGDPGVDNKKAFELVKEDYKKRVRKMKEDASVIGRRMSNSFIFIDEVFGDDQEMLIFLTEVTANPYTANYISRYGCDEYFKYNKDLMFNERQMEIVREIDKLDL